MQVTSSEAVTECATMPQLQLGCVVPLGGGENIVMDDGTQKEEGLLNGVGDGNRIFHET
jgi:hypothetical protein